MGRRLRIPAILVSLALGLPGGARGQGCDAPLLVRFVEGAPRDRFELEVADAFEGSVRALVIDLSGSAGALVFDTEPGGEGVEVFQPFRSENASAGVDVAVGGFAGDGATRMELAFEGLGAGGRYAFSIDVDDTLVESELGRIRVADAELRGATVTLRLAGTPGGPGAVTSAAFDARATATLCP